MIGLGPSSNSYYATKNRSLYRERSIGAALIMKGVTTYSMERTKVLRKSLSYAYAKKGRKGRFS